MVGVSIERLTHDRYKWRGEDIANINTVAQRYVTICAAPECYGLMMCSCRLLYVTTHLMHGLTCHGSCHNPAHDLCLAHQVVPATAAYCAASMRLPH